MTIIFDEKVSIRHTLTATTDQSFAAGDPIRAGILKMLYRDNMSAEQIGAKLKEAGHEKSISAIRHHIKLLHDAGLIQVTKLDTVRGAMTKVYGTKTKILDCGLPENFEKEYSKLADKTAARLESTVSSIMKRANRKDVTQEQIHCIVLEVLNWAATRLLEADRQ